MYVEKLVARRRILGLDIPQPDGQQQQQSGAAAAAAGKKRQRQDNQDAEDAAEPDEAAAAAEDDGEGPEDAAEAEAAAAAEAPDNLLLSQTGSQPDTDTPQDPSQDPHAAVRAVLTGAVAKLVFQNALKAAASSKGGSSNYLKASAAAAAAAAAAGSGKGLGFRAGFLEVLGRYKSPGVANLRQEVLDSIRSDFAQVRSGSIAVRRAVLHHWMLSEMLGITATSEGWVLG
jgi:hypothetical protein